MRATAVLTAAAVALATVAPAAHAGTATTGTVRATLQSGLDDIRAFGVTGLQGQVTIDGRTARARSGVADIRTGAPMPVAGSFRIGSNTKTFVSIVVLQLVGEGRLSLDDPVDRWLPGVVSGNGNDGSAVTIRMLLQHTSGLHNYTNDLAVLGSAEAYLEHRFDHYEDAAIVASAMTHAPDFAPGTGWNYSNTNYIVAGMVIRAVTGRSWSSEVRARILAPLGMRDTYYPGDRPTLPRPHALAYQQFGPGAALTDVTLFNATAASAAGGMVSTTADLTTFWRAVQRGVLLRPRQMAQMHDTVLAATLQEELPGLRYGLGIFFMPNRCGGFWAHPGDVPGTSTINAVTADGGRAVVAYRTTGSFDPALSVPVQMRTFRLLDDLICA